MSEPGTESLPLAVVQLARYCQLDLLSLPPNLALFFFLACRPYGPIRAGLPAPHLLSTGQAYLTADPPSPLHIFPSEQAENTGLSYTVVPFDNQNLACHQTVLRWNQLHRRKEGRGAPIQGALGLQL